MQSTVPHTTHRSRETDWLSPDCTPSAGFRGPEHRVHWVPSAGLFPSPQSCQLCTHVCTRSHSVSCCSPGISKCPPRAGSPELWTPCSAQVPPHSDSALPHHVSAFQCLQAVCMAVSVCTSMSAHMGTCVRSKSAVPGTGWVCITWSTTPGSRCLPVPLASVVSRTLVDLPPQAPALVLSQGALPSLLSSPHGGGSSHVGSLPLATPSLAPQAGRGAFRSKSIFVLFHDFH